jgi:hypothetical protein
MPGQLTPYHVSRNRRPWSTGQVANRQLRDAGARIAAQAFSSAVIHAVFRPERSHALLARIKAWIDTHTDQAIIIVSVCLARPLAHRKEQLPTRCLTAQITGQTRTSNRWDPAARSAGTDESFGNVGFGSAKGGPAVSATKARSCAIPSCPCLAPMGQPLRT